MKSLSNFNYPKWAIFNFIVLTVFGALLRYLQLYNIPALSYQFILHAHSHFAFAGWMFFSIAILICTLCNQDDLRPHFKTLLLLALVSAYGMLASFSLQGYKAVSIGFSTLFVLVTFRFTYVVLKGEWLKRSVNPIAYRLLRASLLFLCLSAAGPFALGPLGALGLKNTPYYQDAVYFYLHFQMNGFMLLSAVGLLASALPLNSLTGKVKRWLDLFIISTIPLFFMLTLWSKPGIWLWMFACIGTTLNLISWLALALQFRKQLSHLSLLEKIALVALTLKCIFQVFICIPAIGEWTFLNRNLIIGYIHLLTLGIIMPLLLAQLIRKGLIIQGKLFGSITFLYIILVVIYLSLLFIQPLLALFSVFIPYYQLLLFLLSISFLPIGFLLFFKVKTSA
jgi:hypothetical protein